MIQKMTFAISGMHCNSCAMSIDMDLEDIDGVKEANTNYAKQKTEVKFDPDKINPKKIMEIIKKTGYEANITE